MVVLIIFIFCVYLIRSADDVHQSDPIPAMGVEGLADLNRDDDDSQQGPPPRWVWLWEVSFVMVLTNLN